MLFIIEHKTYASSEKIVTVIPIEMFQPVPNEQDEAGLTAEGANQNEENGSANERIEDAANEQNLKGENLQYADNDDLLV